MSEPRWWVDCLDPFGRDRAMTVLVEPDHVLLVAPPGETAVLSPQQTRRLHHALDRAAGTLGQTETGRAEGGPELGPVELGPVELNLAELDRTELGRAGLDRAGRADLGLAE
jgi:hypothetical protein